MKKTPRDVIILHMCTKNYDHIMYIFWDMVCNNRWIEKMTHKGGCRTLKFNTSFGVKVDLPNFYNFHQIFVTF